MPIKSRMALCHPDRKHYARDKCKQCYRAIPDVIAKCRASVEKRKLKASEASKWRRIGKHGISREKYLTLVEFGCSICGTKDWPGHGPTIDHNHKHCSGEFGCDFCVRGILCSRCNAMIALALDNPKTLKRAIDYLSRGHFYT